IVSARMRFFRCRIPAEAAQDKLPACAQSSSCLNLPCRSAEANLRSRRYDLQRRRFLWRFSFIRLRRLCLEIFALRLFLREPMAGEVCCRRGEAGRKHWLSKMANGFAEEGRHGS